MIPKHLELLRKWAEIDPHCCKILRDRELETQFHLGIAIINVLHGLDPDEDPKLLAIIQGAVQYAALDRGLKPCIKHDGKVWLATLTDAPIPRRKYLPVHRDEEAGIALLIAYLSYLEARSS